MSNALPDFKRRTLEARRAQLVEEYEAIMVQLGQALGAADAVRLKRQAQAREAEIAEIDAQLAGSAVPNPTPHPRKRVRGIPAELAASLKDTLLQCAGYLNGPALQTILAHEMLTPWRYDVPIVSRLKSQVDMIIANLADAYRTDGQNALVIFLQVLAENYDEANQLHDDLLNLAAQLQTFK
jgi:hypothetical protein